MGAGDSGDRALESRVRGVAEELADVFGADSHADEAGEEAAEQRAAREEAEGEGGLDGRGVAEGAGEEAVGENLKRLRDAGGEFAALLDVREGEFCDDSGGQDWR
jgi:hypothetical protein